MKIKNIKEIGLFLVILILFCETAVALIVPRGDSVEVSLTSQTPDPVEPGGYVELRFKVENIGAEYAKDVVFELLEGYPFSLDQGVSAKREVGDMYMYQAGEEAYVLYYKVRVDKDAIDGDNEVKLRFSTDDGYTWSRENFDIRVQTSQPVLSVNSVILEPDQIAPGKTSDITIILENKADSLLRNIKVNLGVLTKTTTTTTVTTTELPLTPVGSSNEKMIDSISPHKTKNVTFKLIADADATSKIYKLPLNLEYSDILGTNYSKTYYTSVIVGEEPELVVSIESSEIISSGKAGTVSLRFTNKGSSDLKFVYAELMQSEKYDMISSPGVYVGNIDSDDYESADFDLYVKRTRDKIVQLPLRIEYRDSNNKEFKKDLILKLNLYSSSTAKKYGLVASSSPIYSILLILIILFLLRWYIKRKKHIDIFKVVWEKIKNFRLRKKK